jgi:hypothetical protein
LPRQIQQSGRVRGPVKSESIDFGQCTRAPLIMGPGITRVCRQIPYDRKFDELPRAPGWTHML